MGLGLRVIPVPALICVTPVAAGAAHEGIPPDSSRTLPFEPGARAIQALASRYRIAPLDELNTLSREALAVTPMPGGVEPVMFASRSPAAIAGTAPDTATATSPWLDRPIARSCARVSGWRSPVPVEERPRRVFWGTGVRAPRMRMLAGRAIGRLHQHVAQLGRQDHLAVDILNRLPLLLGGHLLVPVDAIEPRALHIDRLGGLGQVTHVGEDLRVAHGALHGAEVRVVARLLGVLHGEAEVGVRRLELLHLVVEVFDRLGVRAGVAHDEALDEGDVGHIHRRD